MGSQWRYPGVPPYPGNSPKYSTNLCGQGEFTTACVVRLAEKLASPALRAARNGLVYHKL
jgi:hypothetical protein